MSNKKFENALKRIPQNVPPIWMMRQAGRYHQHYQNLRSKYSFMELCKVPELAAETAMGPIQDFDFDVAILFSDLLFPLEALGLGLEYTEAGPQLGRYLNKESILTLRHWDDAIEDLQFQKQAMAITRQMLPADKSLIGFVGGPWTLFGYATEGTHKGQMLEAKKQLSLFSPFSEILIPLLQANIELQFQGGAEVVMILDTAAGEISALDFRKHISPQLVYLANQFPGKLGYYSKGTMKNYFSEDFLQAPWAGMGFDHRWDLRENFSWAPGFVQGNYDQALLHLPEVDFKRSVKEFLQEFKNLNPEQRAGWVCGLGHGILPKTPEAHVRYFVDTVREMFA